MYYVNICNVEILTDKESHEEMRNVDYDFSTVWVLCLLVFMCIGQFPKLKSLV